MRSPASVSNDAPVAFHMTLRKYLAISVDLTPTVGLRFEASSFGPCLYSVYRKTGSAAGASATRIGDILGFGERDLPAKVRKGKCKSERGRPCMWA